MGTKEVEDAVHDDSIPHQEDDGKSSSTPSRNIKRLEDPLPLKTKLLAAGDRDGAREADGREIPSQSAGTQLGGGHQSDCRWFGLSAVQRSGWQGFEKLRSNTGKDPGGFWITGTSSACNWQIWRLFWPPYQSGCEDDAQSDDPLPEVK